GGVVDARGRDPALATETLRTRGTLTGAGAGLPAAQRAMTAEAGRPGTALGVGRTGGRRPIRAAAHAAPTREEIALRRRRRGSLGVMAAERVAQRGAGSTPGARREHVRPQVLPVAARAIGAERTGLRARRGDGVAQRGREDVGRVRELERLVGGRGRLLGAV